MSKYDNNFKPEEAKAKLCPWLGTNCVAHNCMAWRWEERPFKSSMTSPGKGWKEDDSSGFIVTPKTRKKWWTGPATGKGHCSRD